jgi:hypothetical protein
MKHEFKTIKSKNETRYVLENSSAGGTGSAAVSANGASPTTGLGEIRRRVAELKDKIVRIQGTGTGGVRNPVERDIIARGGQTGAGKHKDKPKQAKSGRGSGRKDFNKFHGGESTEYDRPEISVHDFTNMSPREMYDETQTNDNVKDGDVLVGADGVGILVKAWPVVVSGNIPGFHQLKTDSSWSNIENGKYLESVEKAQGVISQKSTNNINENTNLRLKLKISNTDGTRLAKIYRDIDWNEYRVKFYFNGRYNPDADYHTDDYGDALGTAKKIVHSAGLNEDSVSGRQYLKFKKIGDIWKAYSGYALSPSALQFKSETNPNERNIFSLEDLEGYINDLFIQQHQFTKLPEIIVAIPEGKIKFPEFIDEFLSNVEQGQYNDVSLTYYERPQKDKKGGVARKTVQGQLGGKTAPMSQYVTIDVKDPQTRAQLIKNGLNLPLSLPKDKYPTFLSQLKTMTGKDPSAIITRLSESTEMMSDDWNQIFYGSDKPAQPWAAIDKIAGNRKTKEGLVLAEPDDESDAAPTPGQDDHEVSMASNELKSISQDASAILNLVLKKSEQEGLMAWQQSKITKAADYMNSVRQSMGDDERAFESDDDDAVKKYEKAGGKITHGKYHAPRKSERMHGSKHIGTGKGSRGSQSGLSANTGHRDGRPDVRKESQEQGVAEGDEPGYIKYEQMKDKIASVLIKLYNQGKDPETIKQMGDRVARHLGYDPEDSIFQDAWMSSFTDASLGGLLDQDDEDDYTDRSMRRGERGMEEGRFVKGPGGVPSDRYGNSKEPKPPRGVSTVTLSQLKKNRRENPGQSPFKTQDEKVKKYLGLEEQGVAGGSMNKDTNGLTIHSVGDTIYIKNSKGEIVKQFHNTPKGKEYANQFVKQNAHLGEQGVAEEKVRLDPKCWKGKKIGNPKTKMKGGVRVNNCVPKESYFENLSDKLEAAINEKAPEGWEGTVKAMKKHPELTRGKTKSGKKKNVFALANWMKSKGYKSHK